MHFEQVREIVLRHARLPAGSQDLTPTADLYAAGLTSLSTVHVMLALEDQFGVEFPDRLLTRQTFETVQSICEALDELTA